MRSNLSHPRTTAALLIALAALWGCGKGASQAPPGPPPPPEVTVLAVEPRTAPLPLASLGQVESPRTVEVRSKVDGFVERRVFVEGTDVAEGDLLFLIDAAPFNAALEQAEGRLAEAGARLELARRDIARMKPLFEENAISRRDLDRAVAAEMQAAADVQSAQAAANKAKLDLSYTRVTAKISGRIGRALKPEGTLATGESLLATISQIDPLYVYFSVSDREAIHWRREAREGRIRLETIDGSAPKPGQVARLPVEINLADGSVYDRRGVIDFADPIVDPQTGTVRLRAEVPNPDRRLQPGMFVNARILGASRPDSILVPQRAVLQGPAGQFVYVLGAGDVVESRPVTASAWSGEDWLIEKGLAPGDRVVVDGVQKAREGAPVRPKVLNTEGAGGPDARAAGPAP